MKQIDPREIAGFDVAAAAAAGRWEALMVDGLPLSTPDGSDWIYVKVAI